MPPTKAAYRQLETLTDAGEQVLSNSGITHIGTSMPSGTASHFYRWSRVGNLVTVRINLSWTINGTFSGIVIPFSLLPDIPQTPQHSNLYNAVGEVIAYGSGNLSNNKNFPVFTTGAGVSAIRIRAIGGVNTYDFLIGRASSSYNNGWLTIQYYV